MNDGETLAQRLTRFEGLFCSGFLIPDPSVVTALALLFEKVHFLNQLEFVIELSKRYRLSVPGLDVPELHLTPVDTTVTEDPLAGLTSEQRETVHTYLYLADRFFTHNALLFPAVFHCSMLPGGEVLSARLVAKGAPGQLNTYEVTRNSLMVATEATGEFNRLLDRGCIPIVGGVVSEGADASRRRPAVELAAALAIKSVAMVLPGTRGARAEDILAARERLKDFLPPFWSSMLKLSVDLSGRLAPGASEAVVQGEIDDAVSTIVRPALIELVQKLEAERKQWFRRILSPVASGLRLLAGRPPMDLAGVLSSTMTLGSEVSLDVAQQLRKVEVLKQQSGLTYAIELHKFMGEGSKKRRKGRLTRG